MSDEDRRRTIEQHRNGEPCSTCGRREDAQYRCSGCSDTWSVPGEYRWHWQGKGHWHEADDKEAWITTVTDHWRKHRDDGDTVMILPTNA